MVSQWSMVVMEEHGRHGEVLEMVHGEHSEHGT